MKKSGAVHINLPEDIARQIVPARVGRKLLKKIKPNREYSDIENIEEVAGSIFQAENPAILVGHSAVRAAPSEAPSKFANKLE